MRCLPVFLCMIMCACWLGPAGAKGLVTHSFCCLLQGGLGLLHWLGTWAPQNCVVPRTVDRNITE